MPVSMDDSAGDEEVRALARRGELIEAIKLYRMRTGVSLREAKEAVEAIAAGQRPAPHEPAPWAPPDRPDAIASVMEAARRSLIDGIRRYRECFGVGLAEAKDAVERLLAAPPGSLPETPVVSTARAFGEPSREAMAEIERHIRAGETIMAIKLYREHSGLGLAQAKNAVDAMVARLRGR